MLVKSMAMLLLVLFAVACASGHQRTSIQLRQYATAGKYEEAIKYLKESPLAQDEKSKLLYFTELGLLEHYRGNSNGSIEALNTAKALIEELYTTRVSGKVNSALTNDNADFYYGEKYEASLVYFYLSLNYYTQAIKEIDPANKKVLFAKARSEVVAWDSFLTEMKQDRMGETVFKEDLLAKTFGALVHESQGNFNDNQIALQLYKDAQGVFFKNYNLFPTFNASYESFRQNFADLPKLPLKEVEGKYVLATEHSNSFKDFLNHKIQTLSAKLKMGKNPKAKDGSISFLIQDGLIAEKTPQKYEIPMAWGAHQSMAFTFGLGQTITYELPTVQGVQHLESSRLQALSKEGVVLHEAPLSVIAPLSELAEQAINEHSRAIAAKTAARVAAKHLTALVGSVATYRAGQARNDTFTMLLATVGHATAVAGINSSEKADVRFWSTLPSNIRMGHIIVPKGTYKFRAIFGKPGALEYRVIELGEHEVMQNDEKFVMNSKEFKAEPVEIAKDEKQPVRTQASVEKE
jgi:hypothetical protein